MLLNYSWPLPANDSLDRTSISHNIHLSFMLSLLESYVLNIGVFIVFLLLKINIPCLLCFLSIQFHIRAFRD